MEFFLIISSIYAYFSVRDVDKTIVVVQIASALYFCIFGYWFWAYGREFEFLGGYWSEDLPRARNILCFYTSLFLFSIAFFSKRLTPVIFRQVSPVPPASPVFPVVPFRIISVAGLLGAAYVAYSAVAYGGLNPDDSIALLIGQFADLIIPCLLFYVATKGWNKLSVVALFIFVAFSVFVGFRTRIVLTVAPLLLYFWLSQGNRLSGKILVVLVGGITTLLFSVMTFSREKFNSVDIDRILSADYSDLLEGLFAEANILFGLIGVLSEFVDRGSYVYAQPLIDSVVEFVPRSLYPEKRTGEYLVTAVLGLLASNAVESGTAYPFVGEYLLMGGHGAAFFLSVLYGYLVIKLRLYICHVSYGSVACVGTSLLAVFFGYYYYSRGYLPQMTKFFVFVVLPYLYLAKKFYLTKRPA